MPASQALGSGANGLAGARLWAVVIMLGVASGTLAWRSALPAAPPTASLPTAFSEARARRILEALAVRPRPAGTRAHEEARAQVVSLLRALPAWEVAEQTVSGAYADEATDVVFRARNVLARLEGSEPGALLLCAHFDSVPQSPGAADDGAAVAALIEVARALGEGPRLRMSVVIVLDGEEEEWLAGVNGAVQHPWTRDVRMFLNLDAAGNQGQAILFQATSGALPLIRAYARAAPQPLASIVGQDLFQGGFFPSDTDFGIFSRTRGWPGLDLALYQGGYAYHTALDRPAQVTPGTLSQMGTNTLAFVREVAGSAAENSSPAASGGRAVYFDVLGLALVSYSDTAARWMALVACLTSLLALGLALRSGSIRLRQVMRATGRAMAAFGLAFVSSLLPAAVLTVGLKRPHAWYSSPGWAVACFTPFAFAALSLPLDRRARAGAVSDAARATWASSIATAMVLWTALLVAMTAVGAGVAYVALVWVVCSSVALLVVSHVKWRPDVVALLAFVPGSIVLGELTVLLIDLVVPVAGRMVLPFAFDMFVAPLVVMPWVLALSPLTEKLSTGRRWQISGVWCALGCVTLASLAFRNPYSAARPKRVSMTQREAGTARSLSIESEDFPGLEPVLRGVSNVQSLEGKIATLRPPLDLLTLPPARMESRDLPPAGAERFVQVHVTAAPGVDVRLRFPSTRIRHGPTAARRVPQSVLFLNPGAEGLDATLTLLTDGLVQVTLQEMAEGEHTPEMDSVLRELPDWVSATPTVVRVRTLSL